MTRTYRSPLREEQMEQTRERILETAVEVCADESITEITVALVAERARVSVRTAYRYFPTKEALLDALNVWMRKRFGSPRLPESLAELETSSAALIHYFEANERIMRASRSLPARELRKRRKVEQVAGMKKITAAAAPHLDEGEVWRRASVFHLLFGSDAWLHLKDHWGFTPDECIDALRWALRALSAQLVADEHKAKKRR